jgi:hypothetical protein
MLAMLSPIRILVAPGFALAAIFSPARRPRLAFVGALPTEGAVFAGGVLWWALSAR